MPDMRQLNAALKVLQQNHPGVMFEPTGSVIINGEGADIDFVAYPQNVDRFRGDLELAGYLRSLGEEYGDINADFFSYRKGVLNIIIVSSYKSFLDWIAATNVCRLISDGKMPKPVRVAIFKLIREKCSLEDMHKDIMERFGGYNEPIVDPVDEVELRPAFPLPVPEV